MDCVTLGVEEEFLVVDAETLELVPRSDELLPAARRRLGDEVTPELNLCQIEVGTPVCDSLDSVERHLVRLRRGLIAAAAPMGLGVAAVASHPFTSWRHQQVDLSNERYSRMDDTYQIVARQQVICGCHVHVGIEDQDLAVAVMNRVRPWMPALLALSANSPYWQGFDTGFASYRLQVWQRWPTSGMPPELADRQEYDDLVQALEEADAIEDPTFLYWYARPSARYPTLEFRVCDVLLDVNETVAMAGLIRSLAWTCAAAEKLGQPAVSPPQEVMEASTWRAARYGLGGRLVSPITHRAEPAAVVIGQLLDVVADGLEFHGDRERVTASVKGILEGGNGADRQRAAYGRRNDLRDVVGEVLRETDPTDR
jgi:glutamate---cysteine ligase / carboxylate-amine ligase